MQRKLILSTLFLAGLLSSCGGVSGLTKVKEPKVSPSSVPSYGLGTVTVKKDSLEKLKSVKVGNADFRSVPLSVVVKSICKSEKIACDLTDFNSQIPVTVYNFRGSLYDLLKDLEVKTGYKFLYENSVLTVVPTEAALEKEREYQRKKLKVSGPKITLNFSGVPLFTIFNTINSLTGYTVIPDQDVDLKQKVFVSVKDLPLDKALKAILYPLGYSFEIDGEKREVYVSSLETKVFKIPVVPKTVNFSFKAGEGTEGGSGDKNGGGSEAGKTVSIKTDFWGDLESSIKNVVSKRGHYFINKTARLVTVTDTPDNVRKVEKVINALIKRVSEQVQFRVAIYEVTYSDEFNSGVDWTSVFGSQNVQVSNMGTNVYSLNWSGFFRLGKSNPFNYVVKLLSRYGKVKTIYDNYVRTKSGETVAVVPSETFRYLESVETESQADTGLVTNKPVFKDLSLGIQVYVTPMKRNDGETEYEIEITNRYLKSLREYTFNGSTYVEPERIGKTQISLDTVIPKGKLEVITGIKQYKLETSEGGVPVLMDVPGLGEAFKSRNRNARLSEYVIAIYTY